jgi:hypothetical protein
LTVPWSPPEPAYRCAYGFQSFILPKGLTPYGCEIALVNCLATLLLSGDHAAASRDLNIQLLSVQVSKLTVENHNDKV